MTDVNPRASWRRAIRRWLAALCLGALAAPALVAAEPKPEERESVPLFVTRVGEAYTISFKSDTNRRYTVMSSDTRKAGARWLAMPNATRVPGTGSDIKLTENVPLGQKRFYRLIIEPLQAPKK